MAETRNTPILDAMRHRDRWMWHCRCVRLTRQVFRPHSIGLAATVVGSVGAGSSMELGKVPKLASHRIGLNSPGTLSFWKARQH